MYGLRYIGVLCLYFFALISGNGQVYINEFQASNITTVLDPDFGYTEWIEFYNAGGATDLDGYYLSDDLSDPYQCEIIDLHISSGSISGIWLVEESNILSAEFKLDPEGGSLYLFSPSMEMVDSVSYGKQFLDVSMGRNPANINTWSYFPEPTPWMINGTLAVNDTIPSPGIIFSLPGGFHTGSVTVELSPALPGYETRYTLDGSWPLPSSILYSGPLEISETTVVRARTFRTGKIPGEVVTNTYILNDSSSFPVISLSTDSENFFDDEIGFWVVGVNGVDGNCIEYPANWNQTWERPVNIEYISREGKQELSQLTGAKINGNCSRKSSFKSLGIYARKKYGDNSLDYPFFRSKDIDSFKGLVLRNSGTDAYFSLFRDGFMQSLVIGKMDLDYQAFEPAVIFLNGEYWGILNIREKLTEHYPAVNYGLDSDDIDMLEREFYIKRNEVISGSGEHYKEMMEYIEENDLSEPASYSHVEASMDINEYMNYSVAEIYFGNSDWPGNNVKYWRPHTEGGRWRWILFDTDHSWGLYEEEGSMLDVVTTPALHTLIFRGLLENEGFRDEFIQRMAAHINTTFHPQVVTAIFDSIKGSMDVELPRHRERWGRPSEYQYPRHTENIMPAFTASRPDEMREEFMDFFNIPGMFNLTSEVNDPDYGEIRVCEVSMVSGLTGSYFKEVPLRLTAVARSGYRFSHWEGAASSTSSEVFLELSADNWVRAVFEPSVSIEGVFLNEVSASDKKDIVDDYDEMEDWIEIHNSNAFDVDLAGWYISDSAGDAGYMIPAGYPEETTVAAGDYLLLWCDGEIRQGALHTSFKLQSEGETLSLYQPVGTSLILKETITYPGIPRALSYGRSVVSGRWEFLLPTPMAANLVDGPKVLRINEFQAKAGGYKDEWGEEEDWIEIYNPTADSIDLGGLFITDSLSNPLKYLIPSADALTLIPPYGFALFWADGQPEQGPMHLDFRLDSRQEEIGLYQVGVGMIDSVTYLNEFRESVLGRFPDGGPDFRIVSPTPGASNGLRFLEGIFINEFMAGNGSVHQDEFGEYDDWIELFNGNDFSIDLGGTFMTDSLEDLSQYRIPSDAPELTTIPAGGYLVLWADGEEHQGVLHLGFKLSAGGEEIALVQPDGVGIIDSLIYNNLDADICLGRLEDGSDHIQMVSPTPGFANEVRFLQNVHINEFMAGNRSTYADEFGEYDDWIELYNGNDFAIDVGGTFMTDSLGEPARYRIPSYAPDSTTIPAKGHLLLWADGEEQQGIRHLGFKLSTGGEEITLVQPDGVGIIDSLIYTELDADICIGRLEDGSDHIQMVSPTPGYANEVRFLQNVHINEFMASNRNSHPDETGEYDDWIELYNGNDYAVDIGGAFMTDSLGDLMKFRIPSHASDSTTIPALGYLILWADGDEEQGVLHLGFKLSSEGEEIALVQPDGEGIIDSLRYSEAYPNQSLGILEDGTGRMEIVTASPGYKNFLNPTEKLHISEIVASGNTALADKSGAYEDWIEIYNDNDFPIDIGGLYLTDSLQFPTKFRIGTETPDSTTIPPKGCIVLWADSQPEQGLYHLGFRLNGKGEQLALTGFSGENIIDSVSFPDQYRNFSYSRENSTGEWKFYPPSPGVINDISPLTGITINEFMASSTSMTDEFGEFDDWIEIYNNNDTEIDVGGLYLTDSLGKPDKFRIPSHSPELTTIPPGGYFVLYADGQKEQGVNHTNFRLGREGEQIGLFHYDEETVIDSLTYPKQYKNTARGRDPLSSSWVYIPPTPGGPNQLPDFSVLRINEVMGYNRTIYHDEYNEYDDWIELYNEGDESLDIGGLFLTDSLEERTKYRISNEYPDSTIIPAWGYMILWADNSDEDGVLHLDMRVAKTGEQIYLFDYNGNLIDSVTYPFISPNLSWGRASDGSREWIRFYHPTPNRSNLRTGADDPTIENGTPLIYPNPALDFVQIALVNPAENDGRIDVVDMDGRIVCQENIPMGSEDVRIEIPQLNAGIYIVQWTDSNRRITIGKFIKSQ